MTKSSLISDFKKILLQLCDRQLLKILNEPSSELFFAIEFNILEFLNLYPDGIIIYEKPELYLQMLDMAAVEAQTELCQDGEYSRNFVVKRNVHVRLIGALGVEEFVRNKVPKTGDVGRLVTFIGTVTRTGAMKMVVTQKLFTCNKCNAPVKQRYDRNQYNLIDKPTKCPGDRQEQCNSTKFTEVEQNQDNANDCKDYQEIRIQEQVSKLTIGTVPRSITVVLEDDLVDSVKPGDDVIVNAIVFQRWKKVKDGERCDLQLCLFAVFIEQNTVSVDSGSCVTDFEHEFEAFWLKYEKSRITGRDLILKSFCPQVYGMYLVKLAVLLVLVGGVAKDDQGIRIRGDPHLLLVGDPGTGKSKFLRYSSFVSARNVFTTGVGSTNAGLTVAAVKDAGEWQLEAGALVLADKGVCCIDEFGSIRESDKTAIHEALEQQCISVAKAGLVCKLNTRCSVLAALNPKGQYDLAQSIEVNTALASPLLSRFDLIIPILDTKNDHWESKVADCILERELESLCTDDCLFSFDHIRAYIAWCKSIYSPKISNDANEVLKTYYRYQRSKDQRNSVRVTIRLLESLIRLAEAHARLTAKPIVDITDAVTAVYLMETSLLTTSLIGVPSCLHTDFPEDPERDFISLANILLAKLGLVDLIPTIHNLDKSPTDETNSQKSAYSQLQFNYMSTGVEESQTNDLNHSDPEESDVEIGLLGGSAMPNESQASIKPSMSFFEQYKYKR